MAGIALDQRVVVTCEAVLAEQKYVTAIDLLLGLRWLAHNHVDEWRQGRVACLELQIQVGPVKFVTALEEFERWVRQHGLIPSEIHYIARTLDRRQLRFSVSGDAELERAFRTTWVSPELPEAKRRKLAEQQSKAPDLVVVSPIHEWTCAGCSGTGDFLLMQDDTALCMRCAGLDHLVFLGSGDAGLTRQAHKASDVTAVVVQFSRTRKRYERHGLLIEPAALAAAEAAHRPTLG